MVSRNGVPQTGTWSVPLFLLATNDITKCVSFVLAQHTFSLTITATLTNLRTPIQLQLTQNNITTWASDHGFRFSSSKTGLVYFPKTSWFSNDPSYIASSRLLNQDSSAAYFSLKMFQDFSHKIAQS